jgi:hypothetical protein
VSVAGLVKRRQQTHAVGHLPCGRLVSVGGSQVIHTMWSRRPSHVTQSSFLATLAFVNAWPPCPSGFTALLQRRAFSTRGARRRAPTHPPDTHAPTRPTTSDHVRPRPTPNDDRPKVLTCDRQRRVRYAISGDWYWPRTAPIRSCDRRRLRALLQSGTAARLF